MVRNCGLTWVVGCGTSTSVLKATLALTSVSFSLHTGNHFAIRFGKPQHHGFMHLFLRNPFSNCCAFSYLPQFVVTIPLICFVLSSAPLLVASAPCGLSLFLLWHAIIQHFRNTLFLIFQACRLIPCLTLAALTVTASKSALWQKCRNTNESSSIMQRKPAVSWLAWEHTSTIITL